MEPNTSDYTDTSAAHSETYLIETWGGLPAAIQQRACASSGYPGHKSGREEEQPT